MIALRLTHPRVAACLIVASAAWLAGCITGERPEFEDEQPAPVSTGNADIDGVLDRFASIDSAEFTAEYQIETRFGSLTSTGLVVQAAGDRRSVTVDNDEISTRFLIDGSAEQTCDLTTAPTECEARLNDARISNTQLSHTFYGPAFANRLRVSADRRIGDATSYTKSVAGQPAHCVDVAVAGGTETFCALDSGVLAQFVGADVTIDLTSYSPIPDVSKLTTS